MTGLMAARPAEDLRYGLRGRELSIHHLGGGTERRVLRSPAELIGLLETTFLLGVSHFSGLESRLARLW